jgi:hypothetical protein
MHGMNQIKWEFGIFPLIFVFAFFVRQLLLVVDISKMTVALVVVDLAIFIAGV